LDSAIGGQGSTVLIAGEAGLGKTRLLEEFLKAAKTVGVRVLQGGALADVSQPFLVFSKALEGEVSEPLFEEHEFTSFSKIFAVNKAGMLMAEASSEEEDLDADIFAGMLSAVQDFVRDSFDQTGKKKAGLGRLEYGDMKILIEHGESLFLTAVFKGLEHADMKGFLRRAVQSMEAEHGSVLVTWSGKIDDAVPIQDEVNALAESRFFVKKDLEGVRLDSERVKISDTVRQSLTGLSKERTLLVILEDLHWADESSLFVLKYLARNIGGERILVLGTFRPGESELVRKAMEEMSAEGSIEELPLKKLDEDCVALLAGDVYPGHDFPETLIKNLAARCDGNPLFVREMLWQMGEDGSIISENGGFALVNEDYSVPDSVQDVVGKRLECLNAGAMALAEYVSCVGREFDDDIALSFEFGRDAPAALCTLKDQDIVVVKDGVMQFSHAIYQDFIYSSIGERWKSAYHKSLGGYYEDAYRNNPDEVMYELARHYSRSNAYPKGLEYCMKAGEKAEFAYAPEQAVVYYKLALESLSKLPHDPEDEAGVLSRIGEVKTLLALFDDAVRNLEKAYTISKDNEFITRMMNKMAFIHLRQGDEEKASELLDRCLKMAEESGVMAQVAQAHHNYAILHVKVAEYPTALEHLERSLEIKKELEAPELLVDTYHTLGMVYSRTGKLYEAIHYYEESMRIAEQIGDNVKLANALGNIGIMHWYEGDMDTALEYFLKTLEIRMTIGDKSGTGISYDNIAGIYGIKGELDKCIEFYEKGISIFRQTGEKIFLANVLSNVSLYYLANGDFDNALDRADESLGYMLVTANKRGTVHTYVNLVNIHIKRGNADKALDYAIMALELAQEVSLSRELGLVRTALGSAYGAKGQYDKSLTEFEKAEELFNEFEDKYSEATLHYEYALMLSAGNNPDRHPAKAREHLEKALAMFEESGMKLWTEKCRTALEGLVDE
jgi:predicted ATPase